MTTPRRLEPGRAHAICRRTARRAFFLQPTAFVAQVGAYAFGRAQQLRPTVTPIAHMGNTTHHHSNLIDQGSLGGPAREGQLEEPSALPSFLRDFHALMARALNTHYGRGENLWRTGSYDNVELHDQAAQDEQLYYTWLQPVKDGLVPRVNDWPAFKILPEHFGTVIVVQKPEGAFFGGLRPPHVKPGDPDALALWQAALVREERAALDLGRDRRREADRKRGRTPKRIRTLEAERKRRAQARARRELARASRPERDRSSLPDTVEIRVGVPRGYEGLPIEEVRALFRKGITEREEAIHREFAATGRTFLGLDRILAEDPRDSAGETWPSFGLNPRIACKDLDTRLDALEGLARWREDMHKKRAAWKEGDRDVVFPRGAYGLWQFHGALVAGGHTPPGTPATSDPPGRDAPT